MPPSSSHHPYDPNRCASRVPRRAVTHWNDAAALAALCPKARVEADRLSLQDGALVTSAGVTAGIDLSLRLLAQDHGAGLARVFAQDAGITPADFVESARADAARVVLESGRVPLTSVAFACGFKDAHNMRRVFRRRLGVSPAHCRLNFGRVAMSSAA